MALKDFERFAQLLTEENLRKDHDLRNQLNDAIMKGDDEAVIAIGKKHGHIFTTDDMMEYNEKYRKGAELTDEDLENVASVLSPKSDIVAVQAVQAVVYAVAYGVQASAITSVGVGSGAGILVRERSQSLLRENLEQLMKPTRIKTTTLAVETGVDRAFIEGIVSGSIDTEAGEELAPLRAIDKLAKRFGVTIDNLVNTPLTPVTIFAPKNVVDEYRKNPALGKALMERMSAYGAPSIRDIGASVHASWGESVVTSVAGGVSSGVSAGVVAYSVAGPTPAPGPE